MLASFKRGCAEEEIWAALERDGAAIVEGFLPVDLVERLNTELAPHLAGADWGNSEDGLPDSFFGLRTKRFHGVLGRAPSFAELALDPLLRAMCDHFLGPRCRDYRISTSELMALGEGEVDQTLHRDADSWSFFPEPRPEILVSANVALTDFTDQNGATVVVPGSHRWPRDRRASRDETTLAVMPRGSALLYSGNVLHGGGSNRTDQIRIGLYVGYLLSWLRPIENQLVTNGVDTVRAAPPELQRLLDCTEHGFTVLA